MQVRAVPAAAAVVVLALSLAACNPATKSKATITPTQVPVATETQADEASAANSTASHSTASSAPASASTASSTPVVSTSPPSGPGPAAGGATIDACSLLTSAQASAINSVTYGAATSGHLVAGIDTCTYANTGKHANELDIQDLEVEVISLPGCYSELQEAQGPGTKVPGVGDDAFGYEIGIDVKLGNRCVQISGLTDAEFRDNYAPDVAMAKIIISKLS
ncbi:MAG TPA: hypothetical protein VGD55_15110 [Acidothermaceae bacterium]